MAVVIPESAYKQIRKSRQLDQNGQGYQVQYKGTSYEALETAAAAFAKGDVVETGWLLDSWQLEGVPSGGGLLTITCVPEDSVSETGGGTVQTALKAVWTCKSVRNDVAWTAYCGISPGANPNRVDLEMWMKETDAELAKAYKYKDDKGTEHELSEPSKKLAEKIDKGVESVIRFYPVLSCTSTWSRIPGTFMKNLGYTDTPGAPKANETHAPSNLSSIISAHEWLKVQDDVSENPDGKFTRTESWMGVQKVNGTTAFDPDLYGAKRWPMPYQK